MATYTVQGPSGKTYTIEGPEGATADQLGSHILSQSFDERKASDMAADRAKYNPTNDMGTTDRALSGIGQGMTSVLRAVGGGSLAEKLGLPASEEESAQLDKPLLDTTAGKLGSVVGKTAAVAPIGMAATMAAPVLGTGYVGATALGGLLGATTTEGGLAERGRGAVEGALGGAAGQGLGQLLGAGASKASTFLRNSTTARQTANAGRDAAAANAQAAGLVLPPTEINPSMLNSALEGLSGKIKTSQSASAKNQPIISDLAKDAVGLPKDVPITIPALQGVRAKAGQAYDAVANAGTITPGKAYDAALDSIVKPYVQSAKAFPNAKPNPIIQEIEALRSPQFDASDAVAKIRTLRADADAAYGAGNKELGKSLKSGANALEDAIDAHLTTSGAPPDVLSNFRNARQTIAKTYSVEKALNPTTGDISASVLAAQLKRGRPLTGELRTIAEAGQAFPKATQTLQQNYNAVSPLDYLAGAAGAAGHPLAALSAFGRPLVRSAILSKPYQKLAGSGQYQDPLAALLTLSGRGAQRSGALSGAITAEQQ